MEEKKANLFREKSLKTIESPEALNDYLEVTSPGVWIVLAAVIVFLLGAACWGVLGSIDATAAAAVVSEQGEAFCLVPQEALESVISDRTVTIEGTDYELAPSALSPEAVTEETNIYWMLAGNLAYGDIVYRIPLAGTIEEGVYAGTVVTERLTPISLLFN